MARPEHIKEILATLPTGPGVYQYFDESGEIIYVGKAKNLKRRVLSYFNKEQKGKVGLMVSRIADLKFLVVDTESEALLLENNLIKRYKPRYNILLKDDKTYPWICIKKEEFPRVLFTRRKLNDGSLYFGPYPTPQAAKMLLEMFKHLYPLRTCNHNLGNQQNSRFRACLEFHLHNCKAPCVGNISREEYNDMITNIKHVLSGNIQIVLQGLREEMMGYAKNLEFEKAQKIKEKYDILENYRTRSVVVSSSIFDVDVFSFDDGGQSFYVNYMKVVRGSVVQSHNIELKRKLEETPEELLEIAIADVKQSVNGGLSHEILVPIALDCDLGDTKISIPKRGDKLNVLNLSLRNAKQYRLEMEAIASKADPDRHTNRILDKMKDDLRLPVQPRVIECFDNSNFQGDYAVAAMVQFVNAKPNKAGYRHFNIKMVEGPDDYASMEEIVYRRYKRLLDEQKPLPQLIVVDGGKGQLSSAIEVLKKLDLYGKISIIGLAEKLEEIYYPEDSVPLYIDKRSETLKVIQYIRDEAHRFGITFHRKKFTKGFVHSELDDIEGIGNVTKEKLLKKFKSVKRIREASVDELAEIVGQARAKIVRQHFEKTASSEG